MSNTVLVTGSSRGIGRAIELRLARDGFDLVIHCHTRRDAAEQVASEARALGRQARCLQFDVALRPHWEPTSRRMAPTTAWCVMPVSRVMPPSPP